MRNSWNSSLFVLAVCLAICFAYNTTNNEEHIQSLQNKNVSNNDNKRGNLSSSEISSKIWSNGGGGGGGAGSWGYGWGWGGGSNGGGGGGGGWCWKGCGGGGGGGGGGGRGGRGYGGGGGGGGGDDGGRRHHSRGSKVHRPSYSSRLYRIGEYARCYGRGRCWGMKLICPLHCDGPCLYDCESNCIAHCRMLK